MIRVPIGDLQVTILSGGSLWLDGGSMFGIVPKTLWERLRAPDDRNRIRLGCNLMLVEDGRRRVLVDTGVGIRWDERSRQIYRLETRTPEEILSPAGLRPEDVDVVVNTHLHFDHAGGNVVSAGDRELTPAFPSAEYVVPAGELDMIRHLNERTRGSYRPEDVEPLLAEGRIRPVEGVTELTPHLRLRPAPGHTPHMQIALVVAPGKTLAFLADLVPTSSHVPYPYVMGYDLEPLVSLATKKRILPEAAREGWYLVFGHDEEMPLGMLREDETGRLRAHPVTLEA